MSPLLKARAPYFCPQCPCACGICSGASFYGRSPGRSYTRCKIRNSRKPWNTPLALRRSGCGSRTGSRRAPRQLKACGSRSPSVRFIPILLMPVPLCQYRSPQAVAQSCSMFLLPWDSGWEIATRNISCRTADIRLGWPGRWRCDLGFRLVFRTVANSDLCSSAANGAFAIDLFAALWRVAGVAAIALILINKLHE